MMPRSAPPGAPPPAVADGLFGKGYASRAWLLYARKQMQKGYPERVAAL